MNNKKRETRRTKREHHYRIKEPVQKYAQQIGLVIWAMAQLQVNLQAIFCYLIDAKNYRAGNAVWLSIRSDEAQRNALSALAPVCLKSNARLLRSLVWVIENAGVLASYRNDAAHLPTTFRVSNLGWAVVPDEDWSLLNKAERLTAIGSEKLFRLVHGDITQLAEYAHHLSIKLSDSSSTLPRRPALQSIQQVNRYLQQTNNQKQRLANAQRRKRSSPS